MRQREKQQTRYYLFKDRETGDVLNSREVLVLCHQDQRNITVGRMAASPSIHVEVPPSTIPQHQRLFLKALQGQFIIV